MKEIAKKVHTAGQHGEINGFLVELAKEGNKTTSYLSCCYSGAFKGYHLHTVREANYVCVRGKITVLMLYPTGLRTVVLDSATPERLHIPAFIPTGLRNDESEEAWIINTPSPAYDPELKGEQVDFTQEQIDAMVKMNDLHSYKPFSGSLVLDRPIDFLGDPLLDLTVKCSGVKIQDGYTVLSRNDNQNWFR